MALARVDSELKASEARYAAKMFEFQDKEIARLRRRIVEGLRPRDLIGDRTWELFGYRRQLKNELLNEMSRIRNFGIGQVHDEMKRQSPDERLTMPPERNT